MKTKQLETVKYKFEKLLAAGKTSEPGCDCDIKVALLSEAPPKMKPIAEILAAVKRKLVCERYCDSVTLADIFQAPITASTPSGRRRKKTDSSW